jgi:hypothetical protein
LIRGSRGKSGHSTAVLTWGRKKREREREDEKKRKKERKKKKKKKERKKGKYQHPSIFWFSYNKGIKIKRNRSLNTTNGLLTKMESSYVTTCFGLFCGHRQVTI